MKLGNKCREEVAAMSRPKMIEEGRREGLSLSDERMEKEVQVMGM